ncbi:TPA: hypothetical protein ACMDN7_002807 [Vibrio parahaemolyticus]
MDIEKTENYEALTSVEIEEQLSNVFKKHKPVTEFELPFTTTSIALPKTRDRAVNTLSMTDFQNSDKATLYKAIIAAYNYLFLDKSASANSRTKFTIAVKPFIEWLNSHNIENRYNILKLYETDRMDELGNHGGYSPLVMLKIILGYAIDSEALRKELSSDEFAFLLELRKTKPAPNLNKSQKSIASYFGQLNWLRREDIGIGWKLYSGLASPKLAVHSLSLTAATVITELKAYENELQPLLKSIEPQLTPWFQLDTKVLTVSEKTVLTGNVLYLIVSAYHRQKNPSDSLKSAMDALFLSNARNQRGYSKSLRALESQGDCDSLFLNHKRNKASVNATFCMNNFTANMSGSLFSVELIKALLSNKPSQVITDIERLMFSWLMASLTVQPYDIPKLKHSDFRKIKVGGRVTHIECEYFKGRAKVFHTTRSVSTRTSEGKALLTLIEQQEEGLTVLSKYIADLTITNGINSILGVLNLLLQSNGLSTELECAHTKQKLPNLMPRALCALISNGVNNRNCIANPPNVELEERRKLVMQSHSPCQIYIFGLQSIKNSAVHAFSDPYTLEYLINRNSHSNKTEKISYLTEDNEEWMNNSGRITREVMFDLIQNVFDLGFERDDEAQIERFNSEFMAVTGNISYKHEEMNSRLRLVTGKEKGSVNEVGVLALNNQTESEPLSPIYVVDSPITVLKMYNYLHEFKKHYKKLLAHNPDFLFKTVMPTVEWLEDTLKKMSKSSLQKGREQFDLMVKNGVVISVFHSM